MREIRFRAWHKKDQRMYPVVGVAWQDDKIVLASILNKRVLNQIPEHIELMQFTGLKDQNGKEIYEGDLVAHEMLGQPTVVKWKERIGGFSCWDERNGEWNDRDWWNATGNRIVIGNIYENPELMEANARRSA